MSDDTLAGFLHVEEQEDKAAESLAHADAITKEKEIPKPLRKTAAKAIMRAAARLLDSPLGDLFGDGWSKAGELARYADPKAFPEDVENEATLGEHEIGLVRNPAIELVLNGLPMGLKFPLQVSLGFVISSAALKVRNTRIIGAHVGQMQGQGFIACGPMKLVERRAGSIRLPAKMTFDPGFGIKRPS